VLEYLWRAVDADWNHVRVLAMLKKPEILRGMAAILKLTLNEGEIYLEARTLTKGIFC
jgi:hypothetical protein